MVVAKRNLFVILLYLRNPLLFIFGPRYTAESTRIRAAHPLTANVLRSRALPQILFSVVQGIVVDVVRFFVSEDKPMHPNPSIFDRCHCVEALRGLTPSGMPSPLRKALEVLSVNYRNLILSKSDKAVGFVKRLSDCASWLRGESCHRSSSQGLVQLSRHIITIATLSLVFIPIARSQGQNFGAGGGVSPNSPIPANQQQGPAYNVRNYGAVGDAKSSRNCSFTNTLSTVTSTDSPWIAGDVGKKFQASVNGTSEFGSAGSQTAQVTITAFNAANSISVSPSTANQTGVGNCVWYTQQDHTAILAAYTAADSGTGKGFNPGYNSPTLVHPGRVIIPRGGYVVCGGIYYDINHVSGNNVEAVSMVGEPGTDIYVAPCFVPNANAGLGGLIGAYQSEHAEFGYLNIWGMTFTNTNMQAGQPLFGMNASGKAWIHDIGIYEWGSSVGGQVSAFGLIATSGLNRIDNLQVQTASASDASIGCFFNNVAVDIFSSFCSNHSINFYVSNSGQRTAIGPHFVLHGYQNDEGGSNGVSAFQIVNSTVNCLGCELLNPGGGGSSVSVDTTSSFYLTDSSLYTYNTDTGNSSSLVLSGNAQVYATGSNFSGNNASAAIAGPSTSKFFDLGGNLFFNQVAGVLTPCTAANILTTCGFSGGVTPVFPLAPTAQTQLGGQQVVNGVVPTSCTITGNGTSTCAFDTGSTDAAGRITITAAGTTTAVGLVSFNFSRTYGTNSTNCSANYLSGTGTWAIGAVAPIFITNTTTAASFNINNAGTNLTATSTYKVNYTCYGQ